MTLMEQIGMVQDSLASIQDQTKKLALIVQYIVEIHTCPACEGDGKNSPLRDDGCMGCSGSGVQN